MTPVRYWADSYLVEFAQPQDVAAFPATLDSVGGAAWYYPLIARQQTPRLTNDPQVTSQWHLKNTGQGGGTVGADADVEPAWNAGFNGTGATIAIVDDGLLRTHQDLAPNYDAANSFDFNDNDSDPSPVSGDTHGTSAAGVAAAQGDNGLGVAGAAYNANLAGIRLIAGPTDDFTEALALSYRRHAVDIYSNSWGPADNGVLAGPGPMVLATFADNFTAGRNGKGSIYTWAAGNGLESNDNVNYDGYANNRHVIAVGAITNRGVQSYYSEPGAAMLVTAYSSSQTQGITTTSGPGTTAYTNSFGGTSSATPLVSGVIALMLDANPNLTARDVRHILVQSADKVNPGDAGWSNNGAGLAVNHKYGFGGINAAAAVALAQSWVPVPAEVAVAGGFRNVGLSIPDGPAANSYGAPVSDQVTVSRNIRVEHVEVEFSASHPYRGNLEVVLTSPDGTQSVLSQVHNDGGPNYSGWTFSSVRHWGEQSAGTWTLRVRDGYTGDLGTFDGWKLNLYGTDAPQAPVVANLDSAPLRYLENESAVVSPAITATDADSPTLSGATIAVVAGFNAAEDRLVFSNQNGISGSYAAATGVLTLTGDATPVAYQAALRSVRYENLSEQPAAVARSVRFGVVDPGGLVSNGPSRTINVVAVNDAPMFTAGPDIIVLQDSGPQVYDPWATDISTGPPAETGQAITGAVVTVVTGGHLFSHAPAINTAGALSFTTAAGANGVATVEVRFQDNGGTADGGTNTSAPQTFTTTISPRPTVEPDRYYTDEDEQITVTGLGVAANDISPEGLPLTVTLIDPPANGALALNPDGSFSYMPNPNYHGIDTFTYIVGDGNLDSVPGPTTITVRSVNDSPVAADDSFATPGGRPLFLNLIANDTDADADGLTLVRYNTPAHGQLTRSGSGLLYTPVAGYQGADAFTYTVSDGRGGTDTATVSLAVTDATAPKVVGVRARFGAGGTRSVDLAALTRGTLPWDSLRRIEVTFSEAVAVMGNALTLTGPGGPVTLNFEMSADGRTGAWTVPGTGLAAGRYTLRLSAVGVTDLNANALARDYARTFGVLPGDFDGNGVVNAKDVSGIKRKFTTIPAKVSAWADLNADGVVDAADLAVVTTRMNTRLS
ncbi:MAG TPA: S8 family serine peptidase [Gemmataceae bacterium]|nr:S8 family serine peptidase [Gemmataceae bacterium]